MARPPLEENWGESAAFVMSLHLQMVRPFFYSFLRTKNLRSHLTILSNLNSRTLDTLFVKSRAQSTRWCCICGLFFSQVKNIKVCKKLHDGIRQWVIWLKIKFTAETLDLFFIFSFKKSTGYSQGLIRLSNNLYHRWCTKTKQIIIMSKLSLGSILSKEASFMWAMLMIPYLLPFP